MVIRRLLVSVTTLALALAASPATALAASPVERGMPPHTVDDSFVAAAGTACAFDVRIDITGKEGFMGLPGGRILTTAPGMRFTATNLATGATYSSGIAGSGRMTVDEDGALRFDLGGSNLIWTDPAYTLAAPRMIVTTGRVTLVVVEGTERLELTGPGRVRDVCAELAG